MSKKPTNETEEQVKNTGTEAEDEKNSTNEPGKVNATNDGDNQTGDQTESKEEKAQERKIAAAEKSFKKQLDGMKKVTLTIPEDPLNPDDVVPVGWNGVIYAIPRGVEVEVPKVIADIWRESYQKTQEVNKRIRESTKKELKIL